MITPEIIKKYDPSDMKGHIRNFFQQAQEGIAIGRGQSVGLRAQGVENIVLAGMGGSAIGGDLLKTYLSPVLQVPFNVNRHYSLPAYVDRNSLVIISSYSGNTEETLEAYREAVDRKAKILCISSGGEVVATARMLNHDLITIPGGLQPRAALGYSFFPLLYAFGKMGFAEIPEQEVEETVTLLKTISGESLDITNDNLTFRIAQNIYGKIAVVWTSSELLQPVGLRWACQIEENAKHLAYANSFPELNHNEIVGWVNPEDAMKHFAIVMLKDSDDHTRVIQRMAITKELVKNIPAGILEIVPRGTGRLARMFSLVHTGDWVSYHLAMLNRVDPTPVERIAHLKEQLGRTIR
jgi:glucose/mannose-6-phosphate isomerase